MALRACESTRLIGNPIGVVERTFLEADQGIHACVSDKSGRDKHERVYIIIKGDQGPVDEGIWTIETAEVEISFRPAFGDIYPIRAVWQREALEERFDAC